MICFSPQDGLCPLPGKTSAVKPNEALTFRLKHTLTVLSYSHWDVHFQVRTCTYIHMDGVGFLVTGIKANRQAHGERMETKMVHMLSEFKPQAEILPGKEKKKHV